MKKVIKNIRETISQIYVKIRNDVFIVKTIAVKIIILNIIQIDIIFFIF